MVTEPKLVLLDEPTCGLDPLSRRELFTFLKTQAWQTSVLIITQSMEDTEEACDQVLIVSQGKVIARDTPRALITKHSDGNLLIIQANTKGASSDEDDDDEEDSGMTESMILADFSEDRSSDNFLKNRVSTSPIQ